MTSLSPAAIGDESPLGTTTFHFTFFSGPNSTGGFWFSATPDPLGPRKRGQASRSCAPELAAITTPIDRIPTNNLITIYLRTPLNKAQFAVPRNPKRCSLPQAVESRGNGPIDQKAKTS